MKISFASIVLYILINISSNIFALPGAYTCDSYDCYISQVLGVEVKISNATWNFIKQLVEENKNPLFLPLMTATIYNGRVKSQEKTIRALKQEFGDDIFEDKKQKLP